LGDGKGGRSGDEGKRRNYLMTVYVVFCKDYEHKRGELMGMLVERRKDVRGQTQWESGTDGQGRHLVIW